MTRQETFKFGDLVQLILEILQYDFPWKICRFRFKFNLIILLAIWCLQTVTLQQMSDKWVLKSVRNINPLSPNFVLCHLTQNWLANSGFISNYIDGLVQDCSNSSALAMELLQSCTKPSISDSSWLLWSFSWIISRTCQSFMFHVALIVYSVTFQGAVHICSTVTYLVVVFSIYIKWLI